MHIVYAETPCHQVIAQIHQHMDQSANQISQESCEGLIESQDQYRHQQMPVS